MTSIIEKRVSIHRDLILQQEENEALKAEIVKLQALANLGTACYMIAHEINNLLTPLTSYAALALNNPDDSTLSQKALQKAIQNCQRSTGIMESILSMANGRRQQSETVRLRDLVDQVFTCLCRDFAKDGITVQVQIHEDLAARAVAVQIQQVLMNLILNARHAMLPHGGILTIRAKEQAEFVDIEVIDTGVGIEPEHLEDIFEFFFTTKPDKSPKSDCSGSGLGLAFCKKVINDHGGSISVRSQPGQGSTFKFTLPKS